MKNLSVGLHFTKLKTTDFQRFKIYENLLF